MSDTVIRVENLCKKYIIGHQKQERYTALRDVLADGAKSFGRQVLKPFGKKIPDPDVEEFWALKDVSFEIKQGDRVGIIGRNGAGKSTLLKILSRIIEPTSGRISIKGRVASLLEVGTGFHPELTGRENIYLNGAILGMSKADIKKKFDAIVDFSGVEKFLDTPVKRYSSGMYVRLAFAVAAHLEPEILIVDEVLAVGDSKFQRKCLDKMKDVSSDGKTILMVSHQMASLQNLCSSGIYLVQGQVVGVGLMNKVIQQYLSNSQSSKSVNLTDRSDIKGTGEIVLTGLSIYDALNKEIQITPESKVLLKFSFLKTQKILEAYYVVASVVNIMDIPLYWLDSRYSSENKGSLYQTSELYSLFQVTCVLEKLNLVPGQYQINTAVLTQSRQVIYQLESAVSFEVEGSDYYKVGEIPKPQHGLVLTNQFWYLSQ